MHIIRTKKYLINLFSILEYIAEDKKSASRNFKIELDKIINDIPNFPYKYRPSIYFDNKSIRDLIYRKYTINYEINLDKNTIEILNIFNKNKPISSQ